MIKRIFTLLMVSLVILNMLMPCFAEESNPEIVLQTSGMQEIQVNEGNAANLIEQYSIPREVEQRLYEIFSENPNADVTVYSPYTLQELNSLDGISGSWGPTRVYNGRTLRDWVVTIRNGTEMFLVEKNQAVAEFTLEAALYAAGVLLDKAFPFGSSIITFMEFAATHSVSVRPSYGDKLEVAPMYTTYETYTYVQDGQDFIIGCVTYFTRLESITYYYYSDEEHEQHSFVAVIEDVCVGGSEHSDSINQTAVAGYMIGGIIDEPVELIVNDTLSIILD